MFDEEDDDEEKKDIEIVQGDGKDLNISPVYDHIKLDKPDNNSQKDKQEIVIPEKKKPRNP